jgi:hypothetical protein
MMYATCIPSGEIAASLILFTRGIESMTDAAREGEGDCAHTEEAAQTRENAIATKVGENLQCSFIGMSDPQNPMMLYPQST